MTVSPNYGSDVAERLARVYQEAELELLRKIVDRLARGVEASNWQERQLANLQYLTRQFARDLAQYNATTAAQILKATEEAYAAGAAGAVADLHEVADDLAAIRSGVRKAAVRKIAQEASGALQSPGNVNTILRHVVDVYQQVVARSTTLASTGALTQKEAVQQGVTELLSRGITGFTDARGRRYNLSDYVQMATRTATARSALQAHDDLLAANGEDLVIIQPGPRACDICDKWAGLILSISGITGDLIQPSWRDGSPVTVHVDASLAEARAQGWGHPRCRCGKKGYFAGVTKKPEREPWDEEGYEAQQRQRLIEKQIRKYKTADAIAITKEAGTAARAKVAEWQGTQRKHLDANPFLKRQYDREQIGLGEVNAA